MSNRNKNKSAVSQRQSDENRLQQLRNENEALLDKIRDKREVLKEKEPQLKKMVERVDAAKREVTADNLKRVYEFLEKKNAEPVAFVMEAIVGLLRNMSRADTQSVEMYIRKHESFMIGVGRLDLRKISFQHCQNNLKALRDGYHAKLNSEEFALFQPLTKLLVELCLGGLTAQEVVKVEEQVAKREHQVNVNAREIEKLELLIRSVDVASVIERDAQEHQEVSDQLKKRHEELGRLIQQARSKIENFDKTFYTSS